MTARRDLKTRIRQRQEKTGESYTAARAHVLRVRSELFALPLDPPGAQRADGWVLAISGDHVRLRFLGDRSECIFRPSHRPDVVPGHILTLAIDKRWTWMGRAHASGRIEDSRIDATQLGLEPLPLHGGELEDLREGFEPFRGRSLYAQFWRRLTAHPRPSFEMDPIAWGGPSELDDPDADPVGDAIELADDDAVRAALMDLAAQDLRWLDVHAHLGNRDFDHRPERALLHFEVGVRIGELSLPPGFDGVLLWGRLYNRPFLRCLHGYGLCLWRLGRLEEALHVFERLLALNPNDNQGIRDLWKALRAGRPWRAAA